MRPMISSRSGPLRGRLRVPGDKSISHRSLMLGAVAVGRTSVRGLLEGEDVLRTAEAVRALGAAAERSPDGTWHVDGVGLGGLAEPSHVLDMGNSGTSTRLLAGLLATHRLTAFMTGDASLVRRPMARVTEPLSAMGARFVTRRDGRLPMAVIGTDEGLPTTYALPVASAQVKSAILLAGLNVPGRTTVIERRPTRDHTEHMLRHFGAAIEVAPAEGGGEAITVTGQPELTGRTIEVPGDVSSAAFLIVAALLHPGSELVIEGVGLNPRRAGLLDTLLEMGADILATNRREEAGEPVADLEVRGGPLRGIRVPAERAPSMIDEYPVLAVAAAFADGTTHMAGLEELRVKESDRLAMIAEGLARCGVRVEAGADSLTVHGSGGAAPDGGAIVATALDHRIAMSFLVLGSAAAAPVQVDDAGPIDTSFPGFVPLFNGLGGRIAEPAA